MLQRDIRQKNSKGKLSASCHPKTSVLDHDVELPRLKRIRGQVDGIERMIQEKRYCIDILMQVKAARSALQALESSILKTHLKGCVKDAFSSRDAFKADEKIQEIVELLNRL